MNGIHILKGTGDNCTCYDCSVLYGGDCWTTPDNNKLDKLEKSFEQFMSKTPTGRMKKVSDWAYCDFIENHLKTVMCKGMSEKLYYEHFYSWLPLLFMMSSPHKEKARQRYRQARYSIYYKIKSDYETKEKL